MKAYIPTGEIRLPQKGEFFRSFFDTHCIQQSDEDFFQESREIYKEIEYTEITWKDPKKNGLPPINMTFLGKINLGEFYPNEICLFLIEKIDPYKEWHDSYPYDIYHPNLWMLIKSINVSKYLSLKQLNKWIEIPEEGKEK